MPASPPSSRLKKYFQHQFLLRSAKLISPLWMLEQPMMATLPLLTMQMWESLDFKTFLLFSLEKTESSLDFIFSVQKIGLQKSSVTSYLLQLTFISLFMVLSIGTCSGTWFLCELQAMSLSPCWRDGTVLLTILLASTSSIFIIWRLRSLKQINMTEEQQQHVFFDESQDQEFAKEQKNYQIVQNGAARVIQPLIIQSVQIQKPLTVFQKTMNPYGVKQPSLQNRVRQLVIKNEQLRFKTDQLQLQNTALIQFKRRALSAQQHQINLSLSERIYQLEAKLIDNKIIIQKLESELNDCKRRPCLKCLRWTQDQQQLLHLRSMQATRSQNIYEKQVQIMRLRDQNQQLRQLLGQLPNNLLDNTQLKQIQQILVQHNQRQANHLYSNTPLLYNSYVVSRSQNSIFQAPSFKLLGHEGQLRVKRACLRSKELLFKNKFIQIGAKTYLKQNKLLIELYLTNTGTAEINDLLITTLQQNLVWKHNRQQFNNLFVNQQQLIQFQISRSEVQVGWLLLQISFKAIQNDYIKATINILLPTCLLKFIHFQRVSTEPYAYQKTMNLTLNKKVVDSVSVLAKILGVPAVGGSIQTDIYDNILGRGRLCVDNRSINIKAKDERLSRLLAQQLVCILGD